MFTATKSFLAFSYKQPQAVKAFKTAVRRNIYKHMSSVKGRFNKFSTRSSAISYFAFGFALFYASTQNKVLCITDETLEQAQKEINSGI